MPRVDPFAIAKFDRSPAELEAFFLFALLAANRNGETAARALDDQERS